MGISGRVVKKLTENGVVIPTPIQERAIPFVLDGKDIIAQAQTGTGKTFAFILPILEKMDPNIDYVQALVVTPTRELALQITAEVKKLINDHDEIEVLAVYGGQDVGKQLNKLKKNVQIVVGTPGRLLDHIRRGTVDLSRIQSLVLDEADQMLHIGFLDEVEEIIKQTPKSRQTMLFSATMPTEIQTLARKHMRDPEYIQVEKTQGPAQTVKQIAIHTDDRAKQGTLIELIETHRPFLAVIFCRTKRRVSKLYEALRGHGFKCDELHGDLSQAKREQVMKRFRDAEIQLLIATDVASRGLDVEGVTHVYNYDIPQDAESYIHRIGRTGRAGMSGLAITLYASKDRAALDLIEGELNITINKQNIGNMKKAESISSDDDVQVTDKKQTKGRKTTRSKSHSGKKIGRGKEFSKSGKKDERSFSRKNKTDEPGRKGTRFEDRTSSGRKKSEDRFESTSPRRTQKSESGFDKSRDTKKKFEARFEKSQAPKRKFEDRAENANGQPKKNDRARGTADAQKQARHSKPSREAANVGWGRKGAKPGVKKAGNPRRKSR